MVGYDHVLSIEHEDGLMSPMEGLRKAVSVLKQAVIFEDAGTMFSGERLRFARYSNLLAGIIRELRNATGGVIPLAVPVVIYFFSSSLR